MLLFAYTIVMSPLRVSLSYGPDFRHKSANLFTSLLVRMSLDVKFRKVT